MTTEYILCSAGCAMCTMYIPEDRKDMFGTEVKGLVLCCNCDVTQCMLPVKSDGYELLQLNAGQIQFIKPQIHPLLHQQQ